MNGRGSQAKRAGRCAIDTETAGVKTVSTHRGLERRARNDGIVLDRRRLPEAGQRRRCSSGLDAQQHGRLHACVDGREPDVPPRAVVHARGYNASTNSWTTIASGIESLEYQVTGEQEGTWVYRVIGIDESHSQNSGTVGSL